MAELPGRSTEIGHNQNTYAGENDIYRDWFAFNVPNLGSIAHATINLWNDGLNRNFTPGAAYNLYQASNVTYDGLDSGPILGSILTSSADTGTSHYVSIELNAAGIAALNASQGGQLIFGGVNSGDQIFGYNTGASPVPYLQLDNSVASTPEPASLTLLGLGGLGLAGYGGRRRRLAVTA